MNAAEKELAQIKDVLRTASSRTIAIDRLYALYPDLDNTYATKRRRELEQQEGHLR